jgi:Zn-finger nucleic acid-binding protein
MNCPICDCIMILYKKQGIEEKYCPQCNEIWPSKRFDKKMAQKTFTSNQPIVLGYNPKNHIYNKTNNHDLMDDKKRNKDFLFANE